MSVAVAEEVCVALGSVRFANNSESEQLLQFAELEELVTVRAAAPGPAVRGNLGLWLEATIDNTLERLGAAPPGIGASTNLDASLSDQLYRARLVGRRGLVLSIPGLQGITNSAGVLDADDSRVLSWWAAAVTERPIQVLINATNQGLGAYGSPCRLADLLNGASLAGSAEAIPQVAPSVTDSVSAMALSLACGDTECGDTETESSHALQKVLSGVQSAPAEQSAPSVQSSALPAEAVFQTIAVGAPAEVHEADALPEADNAIQADAALAHAKPTAGHTTFEAGPASEGFQAPHSLGERDLNSVGAAVGAASPLSPRIHAHNPHWPEWVTDLDMARGPKPLSVIERLFVSSYVPLSDAIVSGLDDPRARSVAEAWSRSFERSYTDAFDALRHRGKRPTMVLDVPDIAARIARLHGARTVQLILVDAMRFDLGLRVEERLQKLLGGRAALAERLLLWSALPSNTTTQLELLGRGPTGLKDFDPRVTADENSVVVAHGRNATTLRRVKTGHRELHKLDAIQARLETPGGPLAERFDEIADETSEALALFLGKLPPRTLAFVFGDHGFHLDPFDGGTSRERHGGATPEEVLVPGFAWLVGDVH